MDQITFLLLTCTVLLGKFADFLMQSPVATAARPDKDQLLGMSAPRIHFMREAVFGAHEYIQVVFKKGFFNPTRLWRVLLLSAFLVQGSFLFSTLIVPGVWNPGLNILGPFAGILAALTLLILVNFVFDLIAISLILFFLEKGKGLSADAGTGAILSFAALSFAVAATFYLIVLSAMNLSFSLILLLQGAAAGYTALFNLEVVYEMQKIIFHSDTWWRILNPIEEGRHLGVNGVNILVFCFTPLIAPVLLILVALVGAILDIVDAALGGRVSLAFKSLARDRKPFFLKLASVLALLGAGAASLQPLLPK